MKKTYGLIGLGIFAIFLFVSLTSATLTLSNIDELSQTSGSFDFLVMSDLNDTVELSIDNIVSEGKIISFTYPASITLTENVQDSITVNYLVESGFNFELGETYSTALNLESTVDNSTATVPIRMEETSICGNVVNEGKLLIEIENIDVIEGFGDEDSYWYLLDEIEVELLVENEGNSDLQDIEVSWELYTTGGKRILSDDLSSFDLKDGKDQTLTFTFKLDEDLDDFDREDAILYIKAVGEIDDRDSSYDGQSTCAYEDKVEVDVVTEDDFVIATDFKLDNQDAIYLNELRCGDVIEISSTVYNLGDYDQDDVRVEVYSSALGIDETFEFSEIQAFEGEVINFNFEVPKDMEEKGYPLEFKVYDEDNDLFENGEDDKSVTYLNFRGMEDCEIEVPTVSAELSGEAKAGEEIIVKSTIRNNDKNTRIFLISAEGYESWAELLRINPEFVELEAGETREIEFVLMTEKDLEAGDYTFNIITTVEDEEILDQAVAMSIEEGNLGFKGVLENFTDNFDWKLWGIILLNVILIIAIILVTTKILRKK